MSCDTGRTLVVAGRGVHGDSSFVSLGKSANRPAKHIYSQLELPEASRSLKRGHYAEWDIRANVWRHGHLDELQPRLVEAQRASSEATRLDPRVSFIRAASPSSRGLGDIAPVGRDPVNPEAPQTYFGWVMRADLDGFTSRVETCFDNDAALTNLAVEFFTLMDMAATFVEAHKETLAQLPWAGDNFTAAAVYASKYEYDRAAPRRLVELALDFEKELAARAKTAGFGGWAYGVAGGEVHGNTSGNVYIATAEANGRRFLIGTGEGFGRSAQAFGDINPRAGTMALYEVDYTRLDESYQDEFVHAQTVRGEQSSLFRKAQMSQLQTERARRATIGKPTTVSVPGRAPVPVSTRPYFA